MKELVYSPRYRKKLIEIKKHIDLRFGQDVTKKVLRTVTDRLHQLEQFEESGVSIRDLYGIDTDYRYVFVAHNYVFYRVETKVIRIINIYNEREDFMKDLFGVSSIDEESERYWDNIERDNSP